MYKRKSKYFLNYRCEEPSLSNDPMGYCILHAEDDKKDLEAFRQKVEERINTTGDKIDLCGCYFPVQFPINFKGHIFNKPVVFSEAIFSQKASFREATFSQKVDFVVAKFESEVDFFKVKFLKEAIFNLTKFSGRSNFIGATFSERAGFSQITFSQSANFNLATFSKGASFWETIFFEKASFENVTFSKAGSFIRASFEKEAEFNGAIFKKAANFDQTSFKGKTDFTWAEFWDWTFFFKNSNETSVKLENPPPNVVSLNYNYLEGKGKVHYDTLSERLIFAGVISKEEKGQLLKLSGDASYKNAIEELFEKSQNLTFGNPTTFHNARFLGEVVFQDVDLSNCSFLYSNIDRVDFRYCEFAEVKGRKNVLRDELDADEEVIKKP